MNTKQMAREMYGYDTTNWGQVVETPKPSIKERRTELKRGGFTNEQITEILTTEGHIARVQNMVADKTGKRQIESDSHYPFARTLPPTDAEAY